MFDEQIMAEVARILTLMTTEPHPRQRPLEHDLKGNFDIWFDGGAVKHDTGISTYVFANGSGASTGSSRQVQVGITLPSGRTISVAEVHSSDSR
jgi:hypothetical protein